MIPVPQLCLLELTFRITKEISNLPHFPGPHLYALFKNAFRNVNQEAHAPPPPVVWVHPWETGNLCLTQNERIKVGITLPSKEAEVVEEILELLKVENSSPDMEREHFTVGGSVILEYAVCRIKKEKWSSRENVYLSQSIIEPEVKKLSELDEFSLLFYSPLRLKRPQSQREEGHRYCDESFFLNLKDRKIPTRHLIASLAKRLSALLGQTVPIEMEDETELFVSDGALMWLDCGYGTSPQKTIGGVCGKLKFEGNCKSSQAELIVLGQYIGLGKNTSFGFGFYQIPELDNVRIIKKPERARTLLDKAFDVENLKSSLAKLPNSSPGVDGITVHDIKRVKDSYLPKLRESVIAGSYSQGELKKYRLPKEDGKERIIHVQCATDRLVHRTVADFLSPIADSILSSCAWAYRKGLNRKGAISALRSYMEEGYITGVKADIESFFESVNCEKLFLILEGILPFDPLPHFIRELLEFFKERGIKGLPQGSPLSPVLSNLYLDRFDREIEKQGLKMARYCDDFVILSKDLSAEEIVDKVRKSLSHMMLNLKEEKTQIIKEGQEVKFLGYLVSGSSVIESLEDEREETEKDWIPVFKENWVQGEPVYLTVRVKNAYSSGPHLFVTYGDESRESIPWNRIGRIVIVGRAPVSSGVIYRAIKEDISVTFIDVLGRQRGVFYPEGLELPEINELLSKFSKDEEFSLMFSREIISAKIHNSYVILRRNGIIREQLKELELRAKSADSLDSLRGYEGTSARIYFSEFANLVQPFEFNGRAYHPPDGPVNAMLSFGYTLLYNRIASALKTKGINPRIGFFHRGRGAHYALASDLLEELRHVVERIVLALIHRAEITKDDFSTTKKRQESIVRLSGEGFRKFIKRFEWTMEQKASYDTDQRMSLNAYIDEMVEKIRRTLKLKVEYKALRID